MPFRGLIECTFEVRVKGICEIFKFVDQGLTPNPCRVLGRKFADLCVSPNLSAKQSMSDVRMQVTLGSDYLYIYALFVLLHALTSNKSQC